MFSLILAGMGFAALLMAGYEYYLFAKAQNLLLRMSYLDATRFATLLFLASIALALHGW